MGDDSDDAADGLVPGSRVGAYLLGELIGQGGMAFVFRASDERLGRRVALKILYPEYAADRLLRARFIYEPKAASAVDHPHIIPVYEAGDADGFLYIAMRYVEGGDVRSLLRSGPLTIDRVAAIVSPVASALDAVHSIALVHRDVKPENILLDVGRERPDHVYLSDWGISKGAFRLWPGTDPGQFAGTAAYVAPERVLGDQGDGRADQYALGCATFEMLCGEPPFQGQSQRETLDAHITEKVPTVTSRRPELPDDLDWVFARVLAKNPEDRYGSCGEFSTALRQAAGLPPYYLPAAPIRLGDEEVGGVHPPTVTGPVRTIDEPRSAPEAPAGAAGVPPPAVPIDQPRSGWPPAARLPRRAALVTAAVLVMAALVMVIPLSLGTGHGSARNLPSSRPTRFALSPSPGQPLALSRHGFIPESAAFSPDGTTIAVATTVPGGGNGKTFLWSLVTGACTPLPDPRSKGVRAVAFSSNGALLAVVDADGSTYLWNPATHTIAATLRDPGGRGAQAVAFSPDSAILAVGDSDGSTYLWNTATGKVAATLGDPRVQDLNAVNAVAFSPDGAILAAGDNDGSTYLWSTATDRVTTTLTDPQTSDVLQIGPDVQEVAFSPDGDTLATGDTDGRVYLWDVTAGTRTATLADPDLRGVEALAFSPDGDRLAVGDADHSTYLWNPVNRAIAATLHVPQETYGVSAVAFNPKGTILATGDHVGTTFLWHLASTGSRS